MKEFWMSVTVSLARNLSSKVPGESRTIRVGTSHCTKARFADERSIAALAECAGAICQAYDGRILSNLTVEPCNDRPEFSALPFTRIRISIHDVAVRRTGKALGWRALLSTMMKLHRSRDKHSMQHS